MGTFKISAISFNCSTLTHFLSLFHIFEFAVNLPLGTTLSFFEIFLTFFISSNFFANKFVNENVVMRISGWYFLHWERASSHRISKKSKTLNLNQHFDFKAGKHLDSAKTPRSLNVSTKRFIFVFEL